MTDGSTSLGIRISELRLLGSTASGKSYGVEFKGSSASWRPLSVIAGPSQTGKTSTIDYLLYCLGDDEFPQHREMLSSVRGALVELELAGKATTIERSATGKASSFVSVWDSSLGDLADADEVRIPTEPPGEPLGLSQYLLRACELDNVRLPVAPTQDESGTQILSIRDLFRVMWLSNDRLDNKNLVFEQSNYMVRQKFLQTVDAIFGVLDESGADLAQRAKQATEAARVARRDAETLRWLVEEEHPLGPLVLETDLASAERDLMSLQEQRKRLDEQELSKQGAVAALRARLAEAQAHSQAAVLRVRNRRSLLDRLAALRGQYADDKKKFTFLTEAERLFDPLHLQYCPACLNALQSAPTITVTGSCSLCGSGVDGQARADLGAALEAADDRGGELSDAETPWILKAELRAVDRRLRELSAYWDRLDADLAELVADAQQAIAEEAAAASAVEDTVTLPAPFMAQRDSVSRNISTLALRVQNLQTGLRLWQRVSKAEDRAANMEGHAASLRAERRESKKRPDRSAVVSALSKRFGEILESFEYPKLEQAYLDDNLVPHVRGLPYTNASSGGMVLISLALYLSIWEVAHEQGAAAPGLLMVDSPQKNLGHSASPEDVDFADTRLVENFYSHVREWLATDGVGAQLIVVDNSPPESVAADVVVHFTRDRSRPPYGLIVDAVD